MNGEGDLVEIQGTAEKAPFRQDELVQLIALARKGIRQLIHHQKEALKNH
jgi:ribonuclease PH